MKMFSGYILENVTNTKVDSKSVYEKFLQLIQLIQFIQC